MHFIRGCYTCSCSLAFTPQQTEVGCTPLLQANYPESPAEDKGVQCRDFSVSRLAFNRTYGVSIDCEHGYYKVHGLNEQIYQFTLRRTFMTLLYKYECDFAHKKYNDEYAPQPEPETAAKQKNEPESTAKQQHKYEPTPALLNLSSNTSLGLQLSSIWSLSSTSEFPGPSH